MKKYKSYLKNFGIILNSRDGRQIFYKSCIDEEEVAKELAHKDFEEKVKELDIKNYIIIQLAEPEHMGED